jgi:hypothetical protein
MPKYSKKDREKAENEIRSLLRKGLKYTQAAKELGVDSPIDLLTLRWMAYTIAVQEGYFKPKGLQHSSETEHGVLLLQSKRKLEAQGYKTIIEQNKIRKIIEAQGLRGNPDLIAIKGKDKVLVEIVERKKASATFVDQLQRFSTKGKTIIVLPVNTTNTTFWGVQNLIERAR